MTQSSYPAPQLERRSATSRQVVYDNDHVIHDNQLAAANVGTTSLASLTTAWAAFSDSPLR
jgi:hypothetical protein